jgi:hypothetical protein
MPLSRSPPPGFRADEQAGDDLLLDLGGAVADLVPEDVAEALLERQFVGPAVVAVGPAG